MLHATYSRCSLAEAEKVLLIDKYNQYFVERVEYLFGVQHPSTLIQKGRFQQQSDEDEVLKSPDEPPADESRHRYGKPTYGTLVQFEEVPKDEQSQPVIVEVNNNSNLNNEPLNDNHRVRFFENKKIRYIWDEEDRNFARLRGLDKNVSFEKFQTMTDGLSKSEQCKRRQLYGENAIHIEVQPYMRILFEEVLGPFYIFQLFSITIWFNDDYYYYGTCIIVMSLLSLVSSVIQIRSNQKQLRDTVESVDYIKVCRGNDQYEEIESSQLVPGDVVVVPTFNSVLQFDGVLINGNVIVNESMLTGESVPVTKTPLALHNYSKNTLHETFYDEKEHNKHTLFCGTRVMQTRYYGGVYVKALVVRVGFQTAKGELIRSIMFPKPVDFRFNRQIHKFIGVLASLAGVGFLYSVALKTQRGADIKQILISALDLITIVIPPALPAAMTIGIIYAQSRLKQNKIFCISPRSINISGCINCVCFDKTGTLTEDDLSFNEVVPLIESECEFGEPFDEEVLQTDHKQIERDHHLLTEDGEYSPLMVCLAACHSLTIIDQKVIGDPLDLQMFEATGWILEEPDVDDENKFDLLAPTVVRPPKRKRRTPDEQETYLAGDDVQSSGSSTEDELDVNRASTKCKKDVGILRQFPFSSSLQRMSVVTRQFSGNRYVVFSKGAPEKIASLCDPDTIPDNFSEVLHSYTRKGFRVLALAYRPLKAGLSYARMQRVSRQDIEENLKFLGLLTLGNLLKPETIPVIEKLSKACIRTVMVTGDNMLTAISVANECGMISSQDKTILLQVEGNKKKSGKTSDASQDDLQTATSSSETNTQRIVDMDTSPVILDVENIQLKTRNESVPILSPKRTRVSSKPRLVWHYVNDEPRPESSKESPGTLGVEMFQDCKMHLALTGDTWDVILKYYPELLSAVCVRGTVFSRMAPHQKQQLVEQLQSLQYYVGMCGDGANDSGALRAAHAGISLSDTEASVAAPFTSVNANISCVPILIAEGRSALVTAFGILKYMAMYSLTQFCSVLLLYTMYTNFTDTQFLYEDLFIIATLVALFGRTGPYPTLDNKAPSSSLLSVSQLSSVSIQLALVVLFQFMSLIILWQSSWYEAHTENYDHELAGHDNFAIFAMSSFQCISLAIVFSKGKPYRRSILSNGWLTGALTFVTILTIVVIILPAEWEIPYISLEVMNVSLEFRALMICLGFVHFLAAFVGERFIVDHLIFRKSEKLLELFGIQPKVSAFELIERRTRRTTQWLTSTVKESV